MKTNDYWRKYKDALCDMEHPERQRAAISFLIQDFTNDQDKLSTRQRSSNRAIPGIIKQFNEKWNSLAKKVEEATGHEILMYDGWTLYMGCVIDIPERRCK